MDLPEFDARPEDLGQVTHQGPEVNAPFCGKVEGDAIPIKLELRIDRLHRKAETLDTLSTGPQGRFFFDPKLRCLFDLCFGRLPDNASGRLPSMGEQSSAITSEHRSEIDSTIGLDDDLVSDREHQLPRPKAELDPVSLESNLNEGT